MSISPATYNELHNLLLATRGVRGNPIWHPERDVLDHQLQVFTLAKANTNDRALWAAALLHDVGKALGSSAHARIGADLLDGLLAPRVVWLVLHHLDLAHAPQATRRRLQGSDALHDLALLRRWDVAGRRRGVRVPRVEDALNELLDGSDPWKLDPFAGAPAPSHHERKDWNR